MRIAIYAEHHSSAGRRAHEYEGDGEGDERWDSDDIIVIEGSPAECLEQADAYESAKPGRPNAFGNRVAATIREAVEDE